MQLRRQGLKKVVDLISQIMEKSVKLDRHGFFAPYQDLVVYEGKSHKA